MSYPFTANKAQHVAAITALAAAGILVASGCSSGSSRSGGVAGAGATYTPPAAKAQPPATTAPPKSSSVTIATGSSSLGPIVVDAAGRTLYRYDKDTPGSGTSACNGACAVAWPPAILNGPATAGPGLPGMISLVTRADGTHQIALDGHPLYRFSGDQGTGDTTGDGFGGIWHVVHTSALSAASTPPATTPPATTAAVNSTPPTGGPWPGY